MFLALVTGHGFYSVNGKKISIITLHSKVCFYIKILFFSNSVRKLGLETVDATIDSIFLLMLRNLPQN